MISLTLTILPDGFQVTKIKIKRKVVLTILPGEFQVKAEQMPVSFCLPRRRPQNLNTQISKYENTKTVKTLKPKNTTDGRARLEETTIRFNLSLLSLFF